MSQPALPQRVPHEVLGPFLIGTWLSTAEPALPHRVLHEVLGTFLIGTWLSTTVFAFEIIQVYRYFKLYPISWRRTEGRTPSRTNGRRRESPRISIMVLWMLAMNVITAVTPCVCAYTVRLACSGYVHSIEVHAVARNRLGKRRSPQTEHPVRQILLVTVPVANTLLRTDY